MTIETKTDPYDLRTPEAIANPYPIYKELRKNDPVYWSESMDMWLISRYDDVHELLENPDLAMGAFYPKVVHAFSPEILGKIDYITEFWRITLGELRPPEHTRARALGAPGFDQDVLDEMKDEIMDYANFMLDVRDDSWRNKSSALKSHWPEIRGVIQNPPSFSLPPIGNPRQIVEGIRTGLRTVAGVIGELFHGAREIELVSQFGFPYVGMSSMAVLGVPRDGLIRSILWTPVMVDYLMSEELGEGDESKIEAMYNTVRDIETYVSELIEIYRDKPETNALSRIIAARHNGEAATENELHHYAIIFLTGGHLQLAMFFANAMYALLEHPDQLAKLKANPELMPSAVDELLRYCGPILLTLRSSTEDVEIGGKTIKAGQQIGILYHSANRDTSKFENPDKLDITRSPNPHMSLGGSMTAIHRCFGERMLKLIASVGLEVLIERLEGVEVVSELDLFPNFVVRGTQSLKVRFNDIVDGEDHA